MVSRGPDGHRLCATYKETDRHDYQDSLGALVLGVAGTVPDGVLLFLSSYSLMDKLRERWKVSGWGATSKSSGGRTGLWVVKNATGEGRAEMGQLQRAGCCWRLCDCGQSNQWGQHCIWPKKLRTRACFALV